MTARTDVEANPVSSQRRGIGGRRRRVRRVLAWASAVSAGALVTSALLVPNNPSSLGLSGFVRIPIEGVLLVAILLVLPPRLGRGVGIAAGVVLGLMTVVKIIDLGSWVFLNRQFDLVADWGLLDDAQGFLGQTFGTGRATGAAVLAVVLAVAVPVLLTLAVLRVGRAATEHRTIAQSVIVTLGAAWLVLALLGSQITPGLAIASTSQFHFAADRVQSVRTGLANHQAFTSAISVDPFSQTPADQLLTGLRGKDVVFTLVESYGRSALEEGAQSAIVAPALADAQDELASAGFSAVSGFLTSSTFGGYSWLAHATLESGMWIDDQNKFRTLVGTDRLTLTGSFKKAGWQTVAIEPGNTYAWPEGDFYGHERVLDARTLGYRGPKFGWSAMPDQYALDQFQKNVYGRPHPPMKAEITLTSSHTPWAPIPQLIDWDRIGDGSVYGPMAEAGPTPDEVWKEPTGVRTQYAHSIAYSIDSVVSWIRHYGKANLVVFLLGDHQAAPIVSGRGASHDVPITVVAKDPRILSRIAAAWGWQTGLHPTPEAPVMRMDEFRDNVLTLFGPGDDVP